MRTLQVLDPQGYEERGDFIDSLILSILSESPRTCCEIYAVLQQNGIGDARSCDRYELSYSSTGAIGRSALNTLRGRKLTYDSRDLYVQGRINKPEVPNKIYLR